MEWLENKSDSERERLIRDSQKEVKVVSHKFIERMKTIKVKQRRMIDENIRMFNEKEEKRL